MFMKIAPVAAAALFSLSAFAVEKEITVTAQIDPTVELLSADGSALPSNLKMEHMPGTGLRPQTFEAKVFSNAMNKGIEIRLQAVPELIHTIDSSAKSIPLEVELDEKALTVAGTKLTAADLFADKTAKGSKNLKFSIKQKTAAPIETAGLYSGPVRLVVTQDTRFDRGANLHQDSSQAPRSNPMSSFNQNVIRHKIGLLNLATELGNVSKACKVMGLSRDTFYRYQNAVAEGGVEALFESNRRKPNPKNRVEEATEVAVLDYATEQPAHGQVRASNELRQRGIFVSPSSVRSIWLRNDLSSFKQRLSALEKLVAERGIVLSDAQVSALEKKQDDDLNCTPKVGHPSNLWGVFS
jgi:transposase